MASHFTALSNWRSLGYSSFLTRVAGDLAPTQEAPVFFLPYAAIHMLIAYSLQLDEQSFGV